MTKVARNAADDMVARVSAWASGMAAFAMMAALLSWALGFVAIRLFVAVSIAIVVSMTVFGIVEDVVFSIRDGRRMKGNDK